MKLYDFGFFIILIVLSIGFASGAIDTTGSSLKEKKLVLTAKPAMLKTGLPIYEVNE